MTDGLNGQALPIYHTNPFQNDGTSWYFGLTLIIGALTKLGLFFPVVCFIQVFDQTLAEQLYCDKGLQLQLLKFGCLLCTWQEDFTQ